MPDWADSSLHHDTIWPWYALLPNLHGSLPLDLRRTDTAMVHLTTLYPLYHAGLTTPDLVQLLCCCRVTCWREISCGGRGQRLFWCSEVPVLSGSTLPFCHPGEATHFSLILMSNTHCLPDTHEPFSRNALTKHALKHKSAMKHCESVPLCEGNCPDGLLYWFLVCMCQGA